MVAYTLWDPNLGNVNFKTAVLSVLPSLGGNAFFVNGTTGSDSNTGSSSAPFATIAQALSQCQSNHGDVIYLQGTVHTTAPINWSLSGVALVGLDSPSNNDRARISSTGVTGFSPLVNVTGSGNSFVNIGTFHGGFTGATGSQVCWAEAGGRNYYSNCQFLGGGDTTTAALAGMRSLTVAGSGENLFSGCTIGLDTIVRATNANASLEFLSGTARNVFRGCIFQSECTDASDNHVLIASGGMDRYAIFDDCIFSNFGTAINAAVSNAGGSPGGNVILNGCMSVGATAIATTGNVFVNQISAAGATTTSIGILAT